jgi:DNA gyrase subunit A
MSINNHSQEIIRPVNIEDEMKTSYINYAMSVIISRALPDVRDGLKPVQRRIITAMHDLSLRHNRPFRKCAKIVGDTTGNYHPHGDQSVYDTLVRMAQEFSFRYPLVDGQGNFGSVDGDPPAAMRYTEARMRHISEVLLTDLEKDTVDFVPNYDEKTVEPTVLPARVPNLLINGATGIAVGMATNIPPHNITEVINGTVALIDNPNLENLDLMKYITGPDFPTGGAICGRAGIHEAYTTGRGKVTVRAVASIESLPNKNKDSIIITEIPFMVNKSNLIKEIANLVTQKSVEGISNIRDESDMAGIRIVVELKRNENPEVILNQLYKHTRLQTTFGCIMLALVDNRPVTLTLKHFLVHFLNHRREVIIRRTRYDLDKAEKRAHILEGLRIAIDHIDEVIALIRASENTDVARIGLISTFGLTEVQAKAILEMRLQRLTGLERGKIEEEYRELLKEIEHYKKILSTPAMVEQIIKEDLLEQQKIFGDERRTVIEDSSADLDVESLIAQENMIITVSHSGYIKRLATNAYRTQRRGGRGVTAMTTKEEDFVEHLFVASTHHYILFFTDQGRCYWLKVYEVPRAGRASRGKAIVNMLNVERGEKISAMIPVAEFDDQHFLIMATKKGTVKKTNLSAYGNPRKKGIIAINLDDDDSLLSVVMTNGDDDIILATHCGKAIRFTENDVRSMGRNSRGVRGINLREDDNVVGMVVARKNATLLSITDNGYGKRTRVEDYRKIRRGGQGVIDIQTTSRNGKVVGILDVVEDNEVMLISHKGIAIRQPVSDQRVISRNTQGYRIIKLDAGDKLMAIAKVAEKDDDTE